MRREKEIKRERDIFFMGTLLYFYEQLFMKSCMELFNGWDIWIKWTLFFSTATGHKITARIIYDLLPISCCVISLLNLKGPIKRNRRTWRIFKCQFRKIPNDNGDQYLNLRFLDFWFKINIKCHHTSFTFFLSFIFILGLGIVMGMGILIANQTIFK